MSHTTATRRVNSTVATTLAFLFIALGASLSSGASTAQAGSDVFYCTLTPTAACHYSNHSLRTVAAHQNMGYNFAVQAGASFTTSTAAMHGTWANGSSGYACHSYSGANVLYPMIRNPSGVFTYNMWGYSGWGTTDYESC